LELFSYFGKFRYGINNLKNFLNSFISSFCISNSLIK
jgi:hypothetical protein